MSLTEVEKTSLKELIRAQLIELKHQLKMGSESSKTVQLDQTMVGRVSRIDAIQQQKIAKAGLERDKARYSRLIQTLEKIDSDDFGYCLECDEKINLSRLLIKPEANYCVACQQKIKG